LMNNFYSSSRLEIIPNLVDHSIIIFVVNLGQDLVRCPESCGISLSFYLDDGLVLMMMRDASTLRQHPWHHV